uniref:ABI family member 3 binding protein n=1 Tax=Capra hircus TaxID=9925 RepID=A0A452G8U2_CAPHI
MRGKCNMLSSWGCLLLCGSIALALGNAQKLPKGKRPNLKVHINTTSDSILLKFLRPSPNVKLEGFLLGYGSNLSPNQYFPLPAEGKYTEAIVDAEPKYLIVVRPAPPPSQKKSCSGKKRPRKPLQLVVGTLSPSSVFLSWGFLINPHHDWTLPSQCPNDRYYTIRYREKDKEKKWIFQLCPATETIVENLKPDTVYEFGVKDNVEGGIWSKIFNHKTIVGTSFCFLTDFCLFVCLFPFTLLSFVIQNVTHRASTKSPDKTPYGGTIVVHLVIPGLNETTVKLPTSIMFEISEAIKTQLAKNETLALPAESKTPEVEKIPALPITVTPESVPRTTKPTVSSALDISETTLASSEKPEIVPTSKISEDSKILPPQTATYDVFSSPTTSDEPEISEPHTATSDPLLDSVPPKTSRTLEQPRATLAPSETPFISQKLEIFTSPEMQPTTPAPLQTTSVPSTPKRRLRPKTPRTKPAPSKTQFISLKPKIPLSAEVTDSKPGNYPELKPNNSRSKLSLSAPKVFQRVTLKPKTSPSPEVSYTSPGKCFISCLSQMHSTPWYLLVFSAPLETRGSPLIPMISPSTSQEELQTTLAETDQSTQELYTTKIPRMTELAKTTQAPHRVYTTTMRPRTPDKPHLRPVLNKTTTRPSRPRPSGTPRGNGIGAGVKQVPLPSGTGRNVSMDSSHPTKKPGTRRPLLPPRPMPPRRKPLPPNNVTGKPGSAGIISSDRVTSPPLRATLRPTEAPLERMETDKKQPTAPASGEDLDNMTDFSSSPTRETDPLGKPRFKGPHVRYIQKPDNSPCSITDSVKRFPKEEATEGNATSPPQNPPTNLTVVTVEGCPSFVILDWDKPLNDTVTEHKCIQHHGDFKTQLGGTLSMTRCCFLLLKNVVLFFSFSYEFQVKPKNPLGEGPPSNTVAFSTESADPRVSEPVSAGRDAIWTERPFNSDSYSECKGKQYVKRTWYKKFVGVQLCNSLRYKIYLSDSLTGKFYNIGDQRGHGEDHCQFVDSFLDGRTGQQLSSDQLPTKEGYFRAVRQEPVQFGEIGGHTQINYVQWYECGTTIPGKW